MSREEIDCIVKEFKENVCDIEDEEAAEVFQLCERKMQLTGKGQDYMKLLLTDEFRNYCFRRVVNATTLLRKLEREGDCMCAMCGSTPCVSRCPNAPEPVPILRCSECKEGIFAGDKYFQVDSSTVICMCCMEEKDVEEILKLCGEELSTAKED